MGKPKTTGFSQLSGVPLFGFCFPSSTIVAFKLDFILLDDSVWVINIFLLLYVCFSDSLKPSSAVRLMPSIAKKLFENVFPPWDIPFTISNVGGIHFTKQVIQALMENLAETSWNYH